MAHVLILYATSEGQTAKIAGEMVNHLREMGVGATRKDLESWPGIYEASDFDAIIIGASVHFHQYPKEIVAWIETNLETLQNRPNAFYSVSLSEAETSDDGNARVEDYLTRLIDHTSWQPDYVASFAGAMRYNELNGVRQRVGQFVSWRTGGETDVTQDNEYTEWEHVRMFSAEFANYLKNKQTTA